MLPGVSGSGSSTLARIESRFRSNPVVLLLGARQCGKTTVARQFAEGRQAEYFDLESPADAGRLNQPMTALESLRGWVVIDEAQLKPELFAILRDQSALFFRERIAARQDTTPFGSHRGGMPRFFGVSETVL